MATLQKIRTKAGLLVTIVIGISLAVFVLGDIFSQGNSLFQRRQLKIGEIDGESIQYPDFQQKVEELGEIYRVNTQQNQIDEETWVQLREETWQSMINDIVMGDVYEKLSISVSQEELFDLIQGSNIHPYVQQLFINPNTGQVDRSNIMNFLRNLDSVDPSQKQYWLYLEQQIIKERIQLKYSNMVAKGLYVTSKKAQSSLEERNKQVNADFVMLNYNSVTDNEIVVSETDLRNFYNDNKDEFLQENTRRIEYVTFAVNPSTDDYKTAENWINDIKDDFQATTENEQFVNSNSDISFDGTWYKKENLPEAIGNWIFEEGADTTQIYGPYFEEESYKLVKINTIKMMPDSVEASHILLQFNSQPELLAMQALADSLKTEIDKGSDFARLAGLYSQDQASAITGGSVGWFSRGQMVQPFEDAAFNNARNEVSIAVSQFGIHIIKTTNLSRLSRQVQVAYLIKNVVPGTRTYQEAYAQASRFASENGSKKDFDAAVIEQKITKNVATVLENDRQIVGLENARLLVRAAFETEVGDIIQSIEDTPIFELGNNYVVAVLAGKTDKGTAPFEDVKARVELSVVKNKKSELLLEKINKAVADKTDMDEIATELGVTVQNASSINFNSPQLTGVGLEPAVIGTAVSLDIDKISNPIVGNNGVFIVKAISVNQMNDQDIEMEKTRLEQDLIFGTLQKTFNARKNTVKIVDRRSKFY
ncbi:MAG: SurA N-terminal domain-containing protein [Bacteroidales bacterium]|jgi:peptidyl-prolyl cis-trans isomerase D|nr:SurA N-terminal domain-containing protein [Bacteroidales bacterium]